MPTLAQVNLPAPNPDDTSLLPHFDLAQTYSSPKTRHNPLPSLPSSGPLPEHAHEVGHQVLPKISETVHLQPPH